MEAIKALDVNEQLKIIQSDDLEQLSNSIKGTVITPSQASYDATRQVWNAMIDRRPAFIVVCLGTADVIAAVRFAKNHNLLISVRGAGHNIAGRALHDKVMLIDLENLRHVQVDSFNKTVTACPGATLGDVDHETQAFGLALPVGINSTTGIAGLTLGGGFGWLSRSFGLTIDNLISAEVVTTDGQLLRCDESNNQDLFWAIKGGGGNFGIVTTFNFKLHPLGPNVIAGPIIFDANQANEVMSKYREFCQSSPDELSVWTVFRHAPPFPFLDPKYHGRLVLILAILYHGQESQTDALLNVIRNWGSPIADAVGPHLFTQFQAGFDPLLTPGARNYWKSHNFKALSDDLIDLVISYSAKLPSDESEIFIAQMGGQTNRVDKDATAYPHRDIEFVMNVHTRWQNKDQDKACIDWARQFYQATLPHATGGVYVNFVSEGDDSIDSAYGDNISKLSKIKSKYDPDNRLRSNLNISPKGS